jgi:hypothetical protein
VRLSPKSIFLGIVALGLPLSVITGWALATPAPVSAPAPGGAGGIGSAPARGASMGTAGVEWTPAPPRQVAVQTRVPPGRRNTATTVRPTATDLDLPDPTLTVPPVPTPTEATDDPTGTPTETPTSAEPAAT